MVANAAPQSAVEAVETSNATVEAVEGVKDTDGNFEFNEQEDCWYITEKGLLSLSMSPTYYRDQRRKLDSIEKFGMFREKVLELWKTYF